MHGQRLLVSAKDAKVRHYPVQTDKLQKALDEACCLAERNVE